MTVSGTAFYVLQYTTMQNRDTALQNFQNTISVRSKRQKVSFAKFGDIGGNGPHTWIVTASLFDTASDIRQALNSTFCSELQTNEYARMEQVKKGAEETGVCQVSFRD